jgi:hypothetical protein
MCEVDVTQNAFHHGARAYDDKIMPGDGGGTSAAARSSENIENMISRDLIYPDTKI